jgi:uncharacterized lipoprotein YddW (UPF0748 family)
MRAFEQASRPAGRQAGELVRSRACWPADFLTCPLLAVFIFSLSHGFAWPTRASEHYVPSNVRPPAVQREFRGVWLASVKNIDWPSRPGLTTAQQKAELQAQLDRAQQLRLNAVLLQVRPSCDALYASKLEPWSEYLTGRMGQAPVPYYDPLAFAVEEAHQRGMELHAWFNPYRARHAAALSPVAADHISRTRPHLVKPFGKSFWLDPGSREVQEHSLNVVKDVVQRYDIDGVHFDDYFYPYPEKDGKGLPLSFPDASSWNLYQRSGGRLGREDWRRENVNLFIVRVSQSVKAIKPWVKFGIAPFGIWRPGHPAQVKGLDAYDDLYADARKWLRDGWLDYLAPQLYWGEERRETSFSALLPWWAGENTQHRHLWPGLDVSRVGQSRASEEIAGQVRATRAQSGADGNILWGARTLTENRRGVADLLARQVYAQPALTPAYPWLDKQSPGSPQISANVSSTGGLKVNCRPTGSEPIGWWLIQARTGGLWTTTILKGTQSETMFTFPTRPEAIAVSAIDRCGNLSAAVVMERRQIAEPSVGP